jgi:hypothetical protein
MAPETRAEIQNPDRAVLLVAHDGLDDGRVGLVALLDRDLINQIDCEHAARGLAALFVQQRTKQRIAIGYRPAAPHHHALAIDQGVELAVADDGEIQIRHTQDSK